MAKAGGSGRSGRAGGGRRSASKGTPVRTGKGGRTPTSGKAQSAKAQPGKAQPSKAQSGKAQPSKAQSGKTQSGKAQSTKGASRPSTAASVGSGANAQPEGAPSAAQRGATASDQRTFRLGAIPGATPGKWIDAWKQRMPHIPLELVPLLVSGQRAALADLDAALIRLPIEDADLHVIPLYDEVAVVVASAESHLLAADELETADLAGEVLLASDEDVLELDLPDTTASAFGAVPTTADLVATVATGVGIAIVPMSLARLHHRKDVEFRVLSDGPRSTVAFAWPRERTTDDVETFVGIIRGRTTNSSR
ncbi:LysR substrate-binding domain-containing protein [Microbacterium sp. ZKA21]|uniref:LysR substrate-binding domain-containing protein n=1 Tax=Microbacterium sp. ZKA21 TaxID=3381694 RepID=UPI003D214741